MTKYTVPLAAVLVAATTLTCVLSAVWLARSCSAAVSPGLAEQKRR